MRYLLIISICLPYFLLAQGIEATVSDSDILIGDHIKLSVTVHAGNGQVSALDLNEIEKDGIFEIVDPGQMVKTGNGALMQEVIVTSFDSGTHYLPSIAAIIENSFGHRDTFRSNIIPISVQTVAPDSLGLAPVKPILEEEKLWTDYLIYILPALFLLLFLLALWLWNKYRRQSEIQAVTIPPLPAHEQALYDLSELERAQLWQQGHIKEYEVRISEILRTYIENKFRFPALELTTREIISYFRDEKWSHLPLASLHEILMQSDMVKFAKSTPGDNAHIRQLEQTRHFILITREMSNEEE